jgi:hypothetical protein
VRGIAFMVDHVFDATRRNLSLVDQDILIIRGDYAAGLREHALRGRRQ